MSSAGNLKLELIFRVNSSDVSLLSQIAWLQNHFSSCLELFINFQWAVKYDERENNPKCCEEIYGITIYYIVFNFHYNMYQTDV